MPSPKWKLNTGTREKRRSIQIKTQNEKFVARNFDKILATSFIIKSENKQKQDRIQLNQQKKYIKSYLLKRSKAKSYFLNKNTINQKLTTSNRDES